MKTLLPGWLLMVPLVLVSPLSGADDIDIYLGAGDGNNAVSRVMLWLDYSAAAGALVCRDAGSSACAAALGEQLYAQLDLYGVASDSASAPYAQQGADGIADMEQSDLADDARSIPRNLWPGVAVDLRDLQRAVLQVVLKRLALSLATWSPAARVEVGLMAVYDAACDDVGADVRPVATRDHGPACEQAYLLQEFTDIGDAAKLQQTLRKLADIEQPGVTPAASSAAGNSISAAHYLASLAAWDECASLPIVDAMSGSLSGVIADTGLRGGPGAISKALARMLADAYRPAIVNPRAPLEALARTLSDILGVRASLVAAAFPANVFDPAKSEGDIYFSLFRAGPAAVWPGNIKKLKIVPVEETDPQTGAVSSRPVIAQAPLTRPPKAAISPGDGGILSDALTFWTDPAGADVLAFDPLRGEVAGRDGRSVTRGGAGQQLTGYLNDAVGASNGELGARQLFTADPDRAGELIAMDATAAGITALSAWLDPGDNITAEGEGQLIRWIRGQDAFDDDGDGNLSESRPWLLGAPLHSRPLVINYGARPGTGYSRENPDIRLFFGSNDGIFHMLRNTTEASAGHESGREAWGFIPLEMLAVQAALANIPAGPNRQAGTAPGRTYGMDGEAVALVQDLDQDGTIASEQGDRVWVFIGQRRGGRGLYAFDMTDPDRPRFKWQITHTSPGFEQLAMTFSTPRVARLDLGSAAPTPVLVFAGGYNGGYRGGARVGKDAGADSDRIGNAIYVVNADDGELVWKAVGPDGGVLPSSSAQRYVVAGLTDSIPSPVTVVDSDSNGIVDRAYVGDSGGNVWRVQLTEHANRHPGTAVTDPSNWSVARLARLGGSGSADRRFFHAPDFVKTRDSSGDYAGVLIVSGDRAAPADTVVRNFAYLLKDRQTVGQGAAAASAPASVITQDDLVDITTRCAAAGPDACPVADVSHGWRLALGALGEKGLSQPLVSNGLVFFTSYLPAAADAPDDFPDGFPDDRGDACTANRGSGRVYAVTLGTAAPGLPATAELERLGGQGRYRNIGPGMHGDVVPYHDSVLIPGKGIDGRQFFSPPGRSRWRVYWREEDVDFR